MPQIESGSIDMILCDLPYAVTCNLWEIIIPMERLWNESRRITKTDGAIVLTAQQPFTSALVCAAPRLFRCSLVWQKTMATGFLNAKRVPLRAHEDILVFYKRLPTYVPQKTRGHKPYGTEAVTRSLNYGKMNRDDSYTE